MVQAMHRTSCTMDTTQVVPAHGSSSPPPPAQPGPAHGPSRFLHHALRWGAPLLVVAGLVAGVTRYQRAHPKALVQYETAAVDRGAIAAKVTATGNLSALVTVQVGSQVSGRIDALFADFESEVKKGQKVATIEPALFVAAVAQARANYLASEAAVVKSRALRVQAERQFTRAQPLVAQGIMSRADYDTAEANVGATTADHAAAVAGVAQSKAALDQAELNLSYTTIVSPIDGTVISRNVDVGQTVAAALQAPTLFTIAEDLTQMQVDTNVAEADVGKIHAGMTVGFTVDAYPGRTFNGKVRQVRDNATTLQNVVTYDAVIDVANPDRALKPGMTASVTFVYATRDDVVRLPSAALRFKPDAATVVAMTSARPAPGPPLSADQRTAWLLRGGVAVPVVVRIGISDGSSIEVLDGDVHQGDRTVVEANVDPSAARKP